MTKPVEWRVLGDEYTTFIKQSQVFYRAHVRFLDSKAGGIPGLHAVAQSWKQDAMEASRVLPQPKALDAALYHRIVTSCFESLMHLGDLSRWRHAEKLSRRGQERYPKEAVGYYELAEVLQPQSGVPQHQLAVLAANDAKAFRAIFHFYRSLCAREPHPLAQKNLELEVKKIQGWNMQQLLASCMPSDQNSAVATLKAWFIRLHTQSYSGLGFAGQAELESEVVSRLSTILKSDVDVSSTLLRMVVMNIGAEGFARKKKGRANFAPLQKNYSNFLLAREKSPENTAAFSSFLRLNIKTFAAILELFERALDDDLREDISSPVQQEARNESIKLPSLGHRTLPSILLYTLWLTTNWADLQAIDNAVDPASALAVQDLWRHFGIILSLLTKHFWMHVAELPEVKYLLPEQEMTIGFGPVRCGTTEEFWTTDGKVSKARYASREKLDSPVSGTSRTNSHRDDIERIRFIMTCGIRLACQEVCLHL
jgi:Est1 DNA/RNA binding domain/Telomerase activating protein Est1